MKHRLLILVGLSLLLVPSSALRAQTPVAVDTLLYPSMTKRPPSAQWVLKFAPLSLFDVHNTVQFGLEHLQKRGRGAWQVEAGYGQGKFALLAFSGRDSEQQRSLETWRARAEYRLYNKRNQRWAAARYRRPYGNYVAFDAFFKQVNSRESGTVGRDCDDGPCNYYQKYQTAVLDYTYGGHVKIGRQVWLSSNAETGESDNWLLDIYVGLGFRTSYTDRPGVPADSQRSSYSYSLFSSSDRPVSIPSVTLGLKLGFAL